MLEGHDEGHDFEWYTKPNERWFILILLIRQRETEKVLTLRAQKETLATELETMVRFRGLREVFRQQHFDLSPYPSMSDWKTDWLTN